MSLIEKKSGGNLWLDLRRYTQARVALGRSGNALPTDALLTFEIAQALARDAVHAELACDLLLEAVKNIGYEAALVTSAAADRTLYLRRPDLGRRLSQESRTSLLAREKIPKSTTLVIIADGLSAKASARAIPLLAELRVHLASQLAPLVVIASQARVALGDEIGELLRAECILMLIGERPGLTTPDSLGAYLTWKPHIGRTDAERNCVSNIHPGGLSCSLAAEKLVRMMQNARRLGLSGIHLKDEDDRFPGLGASV